MWKWELWNYHAKGTVGFPHKKDKHNIVFFFQMTIYVRYFTARRQSWSIRKKRQFLPRPSPEGAGTQCWAQMYEPYGLMAAHCRPGLKYSARPGGMLYISDMDSSSTESRSDGSLKTRESHSTFSSTVFVVDARGTYTGRTACSTSPEVAVELLGASVGRPTSLRGVSPAVPCYPPPPVTINRACIGRARTPLAIPTKCENPAYESESSDVSTATAASLNKCSGISLSDRSSYSQYTPLPLESPPPSFSHSSTEGSTGTSYKYTPKISRANRTYCPSDKSMSSCESSTPEVSLSPVPLSAHTLSSHSESTTCSLSPFPNGTDSRTALLPCATSSPLSPDSGRSRSFRSITLSPISSTPSTIPISPHQVMASASNSPYSPSPEAVTSISGHDRNSDSSSLTSVSSLSELSSLPATLFRKKADNRWKWP